MKKLDAVALLLAVVGALNWGLVALAEFDLVAAIAGLEFGETNGFTRAIYGLVGLSVSGWRLVRSSSSAGGTGRSRASSEHGGDPSRRRRRPPMKKKFVIAVSSAFLMLGLAGTAQAAPGADIREACGASFGALVSSARSSGTAAHGNYAGALRRSPTCDPGRTRLLRDPFHRGGSRR